MSVFSLHITDVLERNRISRELLALYTHRVLMQAGGAIAGVFTVIFVYQYFNDSLGAVIATFGSIYFGVALAAPLSARLLRRFGTRSMILFSLPFAVMCSVILMNIHAYGGIAGLPIAVSLLLFIISAVAFKALYWVPYHVDMSQLLDRSHRGVQLAFLENTAEVNIAAMPFWGGLIVVLFGFGWLFLFSVAFVACSALPLWWVSTKYERFEWDYAETLRQFFSRRNRPLFYAFVGDGIQSGAQLVIWPLLVFLLLDGEFVALGAVATLTLFAIMLLRFITGHFLDHGRKQVALAWGALLTSSGWVLRIFAVSPLTVFAVDTYHGMGQVVNRISVEAISYEQAADNGRFVDEFTVLKEMGLNGGRALTIFFVGAVAWWSGPYVGFMSGLLIAAAATLGTTWLTSAVFLRR